MINCVELIKGYVRYPSISADEGAAEGMDGSRKYIARVLESIGFKVEVIPTELHGIVLAERRVGEGYPTILFYGHSDVQPVDPLELWKTPPFEPEVREGRIYGRGTADNKGPHCVMIAAIGEVLEEKPNLPLNMLVVLEGEEEIGSLHFENFLKKYKERLKADLVVLSDTGSSSEEQVTITTGLRGLVGVEVTVWGPHSDLHSGLYGGPIKNPIQALTEICASLHKPDGQVNIDGFYDDVQKPEAWEREELKKAPLNESDLKDFLKIPSFQTFKGYNPFEIIRFEPTLEFNGIKGGYQGKGSKTIVPSYASAKITCRLVPNQQPEKILSLVASAIKDRCPKGVRVEVELGQSNAPYCILPPHKSGKQRQERSFPSKAFEAAELSIEKHFGKKPLYLRDGGSIGIITQMKDILGADSLLIGLFLPEDNLHAPNESFSLQMMEKGLLAYKDFLHRVGE